MKNKIKRMKSGPEITDGEIQSYMDFNSLLTKNSLASLQRKQRTIIRSIGLGLVLVIAIGIWFVNPRSSKHEKLKENPVKKIIGPVPSETIPSIKDSVTNETSKQKVTADKKVTSGKKSTPDREANGSVNEKTENNKIRIQEIQPVYAQAEPADGYPALYEYFNNELRYPKEAVPDSVQGVVSVVFTINMNGKPENISIDQSLGHAFDREAIRLIENMPLWKPATYNQKPVKSRMSLPLTFQIEKIKAHE
jgi:TonB family protein